MIKPNRSGSFPSGHRRLVLFGFLGLVGAALAADPASAQTSRIDYGEARLSRRLPAVRATGDIVIDGVLDEAAWANAPVASDFIQAEPREGQAASEATEVRVLYDDRNIYFGVFAHDRDMQDVIVRDLKKDYKTEESDGFGVILDTFHDRRNGYVFGINPSGAKWDAQEVNDGTEINANWDGVWFVQTRFADEGWYAEIAIPFKTLKFDNASPQTWGMNFLRRIRRRNEDSFWAPLPRMYRLPRGSYAGTLENLRDLHPGANLKIKPYALGSGGQFRSSGPVIGDHQFGIDAKYGVTTGLTWDFTVNTDFSQVEADEQQVNLTRFSLFFPEKRDFFLENSGVFQFGPGNERTTGARQNSYASDAVLFFSRNIGLDAAGNAIPLGGGTRLTGRAGKYNIGALFIHQNEQGTAPGVNFTAFRVRRDFLRNSDFGIIVLDKNSMGPLDNNTIGADLNLRFFKNYLTFNSFIAKTTSPSSVVKGEGADMSVRTGVAYRDPFWEFRLMYLRIGERFNDEMGYVPRIGIIRTDGFFGVHPRVKRLSKWLREITPHYQLQNLLRTTDGHLDSRYPDYHVGFSFQNGSLIEPGINGNTEVLAVPFVLNSRRKISVPAGRYDFNEYFVFGNSNAAARLSSNFRVSTGDFYNGHKNSYLVGVSAKVSENLNLSASLTRNEVSVQSGAFTTELITARVNYNFSTRMFLNALVQYNTDVQQWSSNIRFNIIHRPLSDFFLVYNDQRDTPTNQLRSRALIAKVTYMLGF